MIKAIIIEDEPSSRSLINGYLSEIFPEISIVANCKNVSGAIVSINLHKPHIVLSDIELPDGNVFDILKETSNSIRTLVLITAYQNYAIRAIKYSAIDYLLKPLMFEEFRLAIETCKIMLNRNLNMTNQIGLFLNHNPSIKNEAVDSQLKIAIPVANSVEMINQADILYCESDRNNTLIYFNDGRKIIVPKPLLHFEEILDQSLFFRIHISYMINLNKIKKYIKGRGGFVVMINGMHLEVAVRRLPLFLKKIKYQ